MTILGEGCPRKTADHDIGSAESTPSEYVGQIGRVRVHDVNRRMADGQAPGEPWIDLDRYVPAATRQTPLDS